MVYPPEGGGGRDFAMGLRVMTTITPTGFVGRQKYQNSHEIMPSYDGGPFGRVGGEGKGRKKGGQVRI